MEGRTIPDGPFEGALSVVEELPSFFGLLVPVTLENSFDRVDFFSPPGGLVAVTLFDATGA